VIPLKDENPTERTPWLTVLLLVVNVTAFVWQVAYEGMERSVIRGGLIPAELVANKDFGLPDIVPPPLTVFTSMFLHGGLGHLAGNLLFLWIFGNNVEDRLGTLRYLLFYLTCGVAAAFSQTAVALATTSGLGIPMVGASGAISGVLAAYLVLYPHARVLTLVPIFFFFRIIHVPAYFFIGLWFLFQLASAALGDNTRGGVAFFAHIGGFVAGLVGIKTLFRPRRVARRR
jgi:membrane associated rhomboid family serine protease